MISAVSDYGNDEIVASLAAANAAPSMDQVKHEEEEEAKIQRLVQWNVDILSKILKQILAHRMANPPNMPQKPEMTNKSNKKGPLLDEVKDILALPQFDAKSLENSVEPSTVKLSGNVQDQLTLFVRKIARLYRPNSFHNFGKPPSEPESA